MNSPSEHGLPEWTFWGAVAAGIGFFFKTYGAKADPRLLLAWFNKPTMAPIHSKLDKICRVIDHMDGAEAAHAAVRAEDSKQHTNWE